MDESSSGEKRKRAPNFTANEKSLLFEVIEKYKAIVDSKRVNAAACESKQKAWLKICIEFNNTNSNNSGLVRSVETLKYAYENEKKRCRKKLSTVTSNESAHAQEEDIVFRGMDESQSPDLKNYTNITPNQHGSDSSEDEEMIFVKVVGKDTDAKQEDNTPLRYYEKKALLQIELLELQVKRAKDEAESSRIMRELQIKSMQLDVQLKELQLLHKSNDINK